MFGVVRRDIESSVPENGTVSESVMASGRVNPPISYGG